MHSNFLFIVYLILSLILIIGGNDSRQKKADFLSNTIYSPFINSVEQIRMIINIRQENQKLEEELATKTLKLTDLEKELERHKITQTSFESNKLTYTLADVVGYTGVFYERNLIINKGLLNNVQADLPAISNKGVVGKIISSSQNFSVILPLTNPAFKLSVMCKRSYLQGVLESDIYGNSSMNLIKLGSDIAVGDTIVTSNASTIFPAGFPIGIITSLKETPEQIYMSAILKPFVDPNSLNRVIILHYEKDMKYEKELPDYFGKQ